MANSTISADNQLTSPPTEYTQMSPMQGAPIFNAANTLNAANNIVAGPSAYSQAQSISQAPEQNNKPDFSSAANYDQYKDKSLFSSIFNALIKNYAKAINSTFAEIFRNVITEGNGKGKDIANENITTEEFIQALQEDPSKINSFISNSIRSLPTIVYDTFFDSLPARLVTDMGVGLIIPLANKLGLMKILPEDIIQGLAATPINLTSRALTNSKNQQTIQSGQGKLSKREQIIKDEYEKNPGWLLTFFNKLSTDGIKYIKGPLNKFLEIAFGIKAPEKVTASDGTVLKDIKGNELHYSAKVNPFHLLSGIAGSIGLTFLIKDKAEAPTGFGQVNSPFRAVSTLVTHVLSRIHTDLFGKMGMLAKGKSFSFILKNSTFKKLPGPFSQYVADAAAAGMRESSLAKKIGTVPLSLFMRMGVEILQPLFTQGIFMIKKDNRIPEDYRYIGHKLIKPLISVADKGLVPLFRTIFKNFYAPLTGLYRPIIDKDTGEDLMYKPLDSNEMKKSGFVDKGIPDDIKELDERSAPEKTVGFLASIAKVPTTLLSAFNEANKLTDVHNKEMELIKARYEERREKLEEANNIVEGPSQTKNEETKEKETELVS